MASIERYLRKRRRREGEIEEGKKDLGKRERKGEDSFQLFFGVTWYYVIISNGDRMEFLDLVIDIIS